MSTRRTILSLVVISWVSFFWLVMLPSLIDWEPAWLAIFGWCEGIFAFGLPDFVAVEKIHFSRFWLRLAIALIGMVSVTFLRQKIPPVVKGSLAWMALCIGATTSALIGFGYWDYLLEVEGRYEANGLAERILGLPLRILYMIGIAGLIGLLISTTPRATQTALKNGFFAGFDGR